MERFPNMPMVTFDNAQSTFRQPRFLASQDIKVKVNLEPLEYTYKIKEVERTKAEGVRDYKLLDYDIKHGSAIEKLNKNTPILDVLLEFGFQVVSVKNQNEILVKAPNTSVDSLTSGCIYIDSNVYFNYSSSFGESNKIYTPSDILHINEQRSKRIDELGYTDSRPSDVEVAEMGKELALSLSEVKHSDADQIVFLKTREMRWLSVQEKRDFIKLYCPNKEYEKYFNAHLSITDNTIKYDHSITVDRYVSEGFNEVLDFANKYKKVIVKAETGGGKTTVWFKDFIKCRPNKSLIFMVPLTTIFKQLYSEYGQIKGWSFLDGNSTPEDHTEAVENSKFVVCTYNQAVKILRRREFDYNVTDEIHNLTIHNNYKKILIDNLTIELERTRGVVIGLTGTPVTLFKELGFYMLDVNINSTIPTNVNVMLDNRNAKDIGIEMVNRIPKGGRGLLRIQSKKTCKELQKDLIDKGLYKKTEILILNSDEDKKNSDGFIELVENQRFKEQHKVILTTSLIDEGVSIKGQKLDVVAFISNTHSPSTFDTKQFFERVRQKDSTQINYLTLKFKKDGDFDKHFNLVSDYRQKIQMLNGDSIIGCKDILTTYDSLLSNNAYYRLDGSINTYQLAHQCIQDWQRKSSNNQFLDYLQLNYNMSMKLVENDMKIETEKKETTRLGDVKSKIARLWVENRLIVNTFLASYSKDRKIKSCLKRFKVVKSEYRHEHKDFMIKELTRFERLHNNTLKLKAKNCDNVDKILVSQIEGEYNLTTENMVKQNLFFLDFKNLLLNPKNEQDRIVSEKMNELVDWAVDKERFNLTWFKDKTKKLKVVSAENVTQLFVKSLIEYYGHNVKYCSIHCKFTVTKSVSNIEPEFDQKRA